MKKVSNLNTKFFFLVTLFLILLQPLSAQAGYDIGVGKHDITDPAIGLNMQGMVDPQQKSYRVEQKLYSRAFIINDGVKRVVLVSTDLWAGTSHVKAAVIDRLKNRYGSSYDLDNVLISGTHNHSGMGGYLKYKLYENATGGFQPHTFEIVVSGITQSIIQAHNNLAPGEVYINKGNVAQNVNGKLMIIILWLSELFMATKQIMKWCY